MITKLRKIKKLGFISDYSWDENLPEFGRYNLFYGWNGSGKTTLSRLLSYLEQGFSDDFPGLEYEVELSGGSRVREGTSINQKIRAFNSDYVEKNVQLVHGTANAILILGEESKELVAKIQSDEEELRQLVAEKDSLEVKKRQVEERKGKRFTEVAKTIGASLVGSSTRNYRKPDAIRDFLQLSKIRILTDDEISDQLTVIKQEQRTKISEIVSGIEFDLTDLYQETESLCRETVEIRVIDRLKRKPEIASWVEAGLAFHAREKEQCEFCGSTIPKGRLDALLGHFNEANKELKLEIERKISSLRKNILTVEGIALPNKVEFYSEMQERFISKKNGYERERGRFLDELSSMIDILQVKLRNTTETVVFSRSLDNDLQGAVDSINELIRTHNGKSDNFEAEKNKSVGLLKSHYLSEISEEVQEMDQELRMCGNEIKRLEDGDDRDPDSIGINGLRNRIQDNKARILSEHKGCDTLNQNLQTFLGRREIVFEVAPEGGYLIKRNGIVARNLSEGEKTAIAFIYFVVHLGDHDFEIRNGIIVVDDPISSLDSNSQFQAFAFLKNSVKDAKQVFMLTHNFGFLKLILNWLKRVKSCRYYMLKNDFNETHGRTAIIDELDKDLMNHESEYHYLFKIVYTFKSDGSIASVYHMPNIVRKVLETFLMFRVPNNDSFYKKMEALSFDENKKTAIYKFANDLSHITGDGFDPSLVSEAQKNVGYLLEMMEIVFPEHYQILVKQFTK